MKIFFHPIDAAGHINSCIGLAQELAKRGHAISFLSDTTFEGHFSKFGFNEILLKDHNKLAQQAEVKETESKTESEPKPKVNPLKVISEQLCGDGLLSNLTSLEKLKKGENNKFFDEMCKKIVAFNDQIKESIENEKPDLLIVDNFIFEPIILHSNIPWIMLFSGNPLMLFNSKELPPISSGYPVNSDKKTWREFEDVLNKQFTRIFRDKQNEILQKFNYPNLELNDDLFNRSPYLNIYGYPEELDYQDVIASPKNFISVDAFCRKMPEPFEFPDEFKNKIKPGDKLIYVSLGSMGSFNIELMKRMVDILGKTPHKYIVSKGPLHDEYELADNMWGEEYVPQTSILPLVDLVITHGGNNTITETFSFGKPMIVMPLFGDQWDNAQRVHEKGYGIRLHTHEYTEQELVDSVNLLLNDTELNQKLRTISKRIQNSNSKEKACIAIEQLVKKLRNKQTDSK